MGYTFLDHTGDIRVEIRAADRQQLFSEALIAFTDCLTDREGVEEISSRQFELEAADMDLLLVEWLSELLYTFEAHELLFRRAEVSFEGETNGILRLRATAWGEPFDPRRHPVHVTIKAVTYHGLEVQESEDGGWVARVVFDV
jgi:SHS2 domain-containing protein